MVKFERSLLFHLVMSYASLNRYTNKIFIGKPNKYFVSLNQIKLLL